MQDPRELEKLLVSKTGCNPHSHGDVLSLGFKDGSTLFIWPFQNGLEAVAIGTYGEVEGEFRSEACKAESDKMVSQFPDLGQWVVTHSENIPTLTGERVWNGFNCCVCLQVTTLLSEPERGSRLAWYCAWCGARQRVPGLGME